MRNSPKLSTLELLTLWDELIEVIENVLIGLLNPIGTTPGREFLYG